VLLSQRVFGVMELFRTEVCEPDESLLPILTAIGSQFAQFIKRLQAQRQLQQRIEHLESIYQLNDAVTQADALDAIYQEALKGILAALKADRASILLFDPDGIMRFKAWRGLSDTYRRATEGHTPWRPDTPDPEPVFIEDIAHDESLGALQPIVMREGIQALGFFALTHHGQVVGKFMVYYDTPHHFTDAETQLALIIAGHIAFAVERHRREAELRHSRAQLTDFVENAVTGLHWVGPDGKILWANQAELDLLGYTREEYIGHHIAEFHVDASVIEDILDRFANNQSLHAYEARLRCKDRSIKTVLIDSNALWEDGQFIHSRCFTRDITERKLSEEALHEAVLFHRRLEAQLASLVEASSTLLSSPKIDVVLENVLRISRELFSADAHAVWRNDASSDNWRVIAARGLSETYQLSTINHTQSSQLLEQLILAENVMEHPMLASRHEIYKRENIRSLMVVPLRIHGAISGAIAFYYHVPRSFNEIEVRVATAMANIVASAIGTAELYEEQQRLRTQAQQSERRASLLAQASTVLNSLLSYDAILKSLSQIVIPELADWCAIFLIEANGQIFITDLRAARSDKQQILDKLRDHQFDVNGPSGAAHVLRTGKSLFIPEVDLSTVKTYVEDSSLLAVVQALGSQSNITVPLQTRERILGAFSLNMGESKRHYTSDDLRLLEELARRATIAIENAQLYHDAEQARNKAETAVQLRDEFLSVAAHELRTPVTSLRGFAQTLLRQLDHGREIDEPQWRRVLERINSQSIKLATLVGRLLDISRLETGRLILEYETTKIAPLIQAMVDQAQSSTSIHMIDFHPSATVEALIDPLRIEQVISNLLDNAIKYSPDGGAIEVKLASIGETHFQIQITDHGIGIPMEHRDHIFDRFYQAHQSSSVGGLGLGLHISRQIVELHGGKLEARFPENGGTCIIITLSNTPAKP
jgi:PAS domain S-box-containing protein